ncbi:dihydrodipicolinate synthase family protein [Salipiger marinus]|jgi:4-hydroxy-tetrahydrodipicolinate synthase|uniref:dihydrodipicolinate synthase family protein n=2 Tax=Salipiger marinus TaxID=555512 RepID=UPI000E8A0791|nr:dihydrodipicolinate synthase family protein [Salipiger manganoxidans]MCD1617733.1 dihydrodipicolinate synthase family protein [Salipiger manganoxidans]MEB3418265.1 dihydrodipicolinate synthase family protein [Salipiger manganoxidans]HBM58898.1 dihydrodipicolinate synthase family protein [Citreicella sp.]
MTLTGKDLRGITVATVLPFDDSGAIDWDGYAAVLDHCARPETTNCVFVNGHAGEATALSDAERAEVIRRTRDQIGAGRPLLAGVVPTGIPDALRQAEAARAAGADVAVIFPAEALGGGNASTPAAVRMYELLARELQMPLSHFQFPIASGFGLSTPVLAEIAQIPEVIAVKEGSATLLAYDENRRAIKAASPDTAMLPSNFHWFFAQVALGGDGILSGLASLVPGLLADLWRASEAMDLAAMRAANDRLYPVVRAIYGPAPVIDMHSRMKDGLQMMGVIRNPSPRLPLLPQSDDIREGVRRALIAAEVL